MVGAVEEVVAAVTALFVVWDAVEPLALGPVDVVVVSVGVTVEGSPEVVLGVWVDAPDGASGVEVLLSNANVFAECIVAASNNPPLTAPATRCFFLVLIILMSAPFNLLNPPGGEN